MKLVIFGLTLSSSWGNGHATLWRGLCRALARKGHRVVFFERDVPCYAHHRDLAELPGTDLRLYTSWEEVLPEARRETADADAAMVTSYCPDGVAASDLVLSTSGPLSVFYDLDTPVTLERLRSGQEISYLPPQGLGSFDLVLSYTGGQALMELQERLGARRVAPLYGSVSEYLVERMILAEVFQQFHGLWRERGGQDVYVGTLVNAWLARGGEARGVRAGESYVDVGTLHGYRKAIQLLERREVFA